MAFSAGIQGQMLEITVVGCNRLKDTEWFTKQDPYVCIDYGTSKFRSTVCLGGDTNPTYHEKTIVKLVEGLRELEVAVWNKHNLSNDNFIGSGKVQIEKVLSKGFDDRTWPIQTKTGRYAGEVCLIMRYSKAKPKSYGQSEAPPPPPPPRPAAAPYPQPWHPFYPNFHHPPPPFPQHGAAYPPQPCPPQPYPPQRSTHQNIGYPPNPYQNYRQY